MKIRMENGNDTGCKWERIELTNRETKYLSNFKTGRTQNDKKTDVFHKLCKKFVKHISILSVPRYQFGFTAVEKNITIS